jgi:hypothetical protein
LQARKDWFFIAMPNAMGVAFNAVALLLCAIFPAPEQLQADIDGRGPSMIKRMLRSFKGHSSATEPVAPEPTSVSDLTIDLGSEQQHAHAK